MKYFITYLFLLLTVFLTNAQEEDLLSLLEEEETTERVSASFKTTRIINGHSIENTSGGVLDFKISHRFGFINSGARNLFGLDVADMRIGFDYGLSDRLMIGIGRSNLEKSYDAFLKCKLLWQSKGQKAIPISISYLVGLSIKTIPFQNPDRENYVSSKLFYHHQLLLARKFNEDLSIQIMPTLVHRNLVRNLTEKNDVLSLGFAGRQKLSKRTSINIEYYYVFENQLAPGYTNSLSVGFDIETGGHVFQLHFTNSRSMNYRGFIGETTGRWENGDIRFGFNVSRVFTIKRPKVKEF
jgi:hypothetical protein